MTDRLLHLAAQRAARRDFYLAALLLPYATAEGLGERELAERLGCRPDDLPRLLLCRRPRPDPAGFQEDVRRIAEAFSLDPNRLAEVVRLAEALRALQAENEAASGWLAAARDRPPEPPPEDQP